MKIIQNYASLFNYKTDGWVKNLVLESPNVKGNTASDYVTTGGLILNATNTIYE